MNNVGAPVKNGVRAVPLRCMPQRKVNKPPVRGGVLDAPPPDDGRRRLHAETFPTRRRGGLPRPPGLGQRTTSDARTKWCAGCARDIAFVGWRTRDGRTVGDAGAVGQARRLRLARPGNHPTEGASRTPPPTVGAKRALRHMTRRVRFLTLHKWCAGCARGIGCVG